LELEPGKTYSLWAVASRDSTVTVSIISGAAVNGISTISVGGTWQQFRLGPVEFKIGTSASVQSQNPYLYLCLQYINISNILKNYILCKTLILATIRRTKVSASIHNKLCLGSS
jgi:hypothetical protein